MNKCEGLDNNQDESPKKIELAKQFIRAALLNQGERPQKEVVAEAIEAGFAKRTVERAAHGDWITKRKAGLTAGWLWSWVAESPKTAK